MGHLESTAGKRTVLEATNTPLKIHIQTVEDIELVKPVCVKGIDNLVRLEESNGGTKDFVWVVEVYELRDILVVVPVWSTNEIGIVSMQPERELLHD